MWTSSFPGLSRPGLLRFPGLSTCGRRNSLPCMGIEPGTLRAGVWLQCDDPYGDRTWDPPSDGPVFSPLRCTSTLRCSDCSTSIWASSACTFLKLGIYRQFSLTTLLSSSACTFLKLSRYRQFSLTTLLSSSACTFVFWQIGIYRQCPD